jgi:phytoene dehydrogenase-like protein
MSDVTTHDIAIIGAGHNGLVTAFYLANAGFKPLVLEARDEVGGCAVTGEVHPGFRCPTLAHAAGPLLADVVRDMRLEAHGLTLRRVAPLVFAPLPDGRALILGDDAARTGESIARFSRRDAEAYGRFRAAAAAIGAVVARVLTGPPPEIDEPTAGDVWRLLGVSRGFRRLGRENAFRLLRWTTMPVADLVAEWFETDALRAVFAARGIFGTFAGPRSAGTGAAFLWQLGYEAVGRTGIVVGGLGALTAAMASAARARGAEIRTGAPVERILVRGGRAAGVVLQSGEEIGARAVVSNADPRRTLIDLVGPRHLDPETVEKLRAYRCRGTAAKVNLALDALPTFSASTARDGELLSGAVHLGPGVDYLERAFDASKYGRFSPEPYLDVRIPTLADHSLAPSGKHVMSIYMQFAPYAVGGGWATNRDALGDAIVRTVAAYAPDLPSRVLARQVITPADLESQYGLTGGHIFHGEPALDQLYTMRPLLGWARYATPVADLFLCGAGTHPGGGVTGAPGRNAARQIVRALRHGLSG